MSEDSIAQKIAKLTPQEQEVFFDAFTQEQIKALQYDWKFWGRPKQLECINEKDWDIWLYNCGRAFGKTRTGSEWVRHVAESNPGCRIALIAPTASAVRDIMVLGQSGLLAVCPEGTVRYERSKSRLVWENGSIANMLSADEPARIRGFNFHYAWLDEVASFRYEEAFDMVRYALREGVRPQMLITTTPEVNDLMLRIFDLIEKESDRYKMTTGSSYENAFLPESTIRQFKENEDTELGQQEIFAIISRQKKGALFKPEWIKIYPKFDLKNDRIVQEPVYGRTVVAVDIAVTANKNSDFTTICVASEGQKGDDRFYIRDIKGYKTFPKEWAEEIVKAYYEYDADLVVVEVNQGGDLIREQIEAVNEVLFVNGEKKVYRGVNVPIKEIKAHDGKRLRAEAVSQLYQKQRVWHIGHLPELEKQMINFVGKESKKDDYVDAMVYAIRELAGDSLNLNYFIPKVGGYRESVNLQLL